MASKNPKTARQDVQKKHANALRFAKGKPSAAFMKALDDVAKMTPAKGPKD